MTITISTADASFVDGLVATGTYSSPEAVVQEALSQMREREEQLARLRMELQRGIEQAEQGNLRELNAAEFKALARKNLTALSK